MTSKYEYNCLSFGSIANQLSSDAEDHCLLVLLYCRLTKIELLIKSKTRNPNVCHFWMHNIFEMFDLPDIKELDPCFEALTISLRGVFKNIWYYNKDGNPQSNPVESYPHIRYLRHESESRSARNTTCNTTLRDAIAAAQQVEDFLQNKLVRRDAAR